MRKVFRYRGHGGRKNGVHALEHVAIAEAVLGRELPRGAEVHHVNGDGRDNRHQNLVICQSRAYHKLLHARARIAAAGGDPNTQRICTLCRGLRPVSEMVTSNGLITGQCMRCSRDRSERYRRARGIQPCGRRGRFGAHVRSREIADDYVPRPRD